MNRRMPLATKKAHRLARWREIRQPKADHKQRQSRTAKARLPLSNLKLDDAASDARVANQRAATIIDTARATNKAKHATLDAVASLGGLTPPAQGRLLE